MIRYAIKITENEGDIESKGSGYNKKKPKYLIPNENIDEENLIELFKDTYLYLSGTPNYRPKNNKYHGRK